MFRYLFNRFVVRRHFWRHASFGEVAELYTSRILRVMGINIAAGFASVYLYQQGYSIMSLAAIWAIYFLFKVLILPLTTIYIAKFGPKHGILISNFLYIPAMVALWLFEQLGFISIIVWSVSLAASTSLYAVSYLVDFSKVKSIGHAGKELGFMNIFERIAAGLSPIIGGLVALFFGPQTVMLAGALIFLLSAIPLFKTGEQIKLHQKLDIQGFPWKATSRTIFSRTGLGIDYVSAAFVWSLFIVVTIFPNFGDEIYITLGVLSSVAMLSAVITSYVYGRIIDRNRGGELFKYGLIANSAVNISKFFVATPVAVVAVNVVNELSAAAYHMPYMRGIFDEADRSGHRILYICLAEMASNFGASVSCAVMLVSVVLFGEADGLRYMFLFAAVGMPIMYLAKFRLYRK